MAGEIRLNVTDRQEVFKGMYKMERCKKALLITKGLERWGNALSSFKLV